MISHLQRVWFRRSTLGRAPCWHEKALAAGSGFGGGRCDNVRGEFENGMRRLEGGIEYPVEGED